MNKNNLINQYALKMEQDSSDLFSKYQYVLSAYLFGSTALGISNSDSDMDIAIRIDKSLASDSYLDLRIQIIDDLEKHLGCKVDIVVLNTASLKMIHQVIVNGRLLFSRDPEKEQDYIVQKRKEYFDFKYYINKDIREMRSYFGVSENA
jgi:predicted nucleotidyltransferase